MRPLLGRCTVGNWQSLWQNEGETRKSHGSEANFRSNQGVLWALVGDGSQMSRCQGKAETALARHLCVGPVHGIDNRHFIGLNQGRTCIFFNMARDREETKLKILQAVGQVLAQSGFQGIGVNAIAREAGVDKVLIYRYFTDLPTLLKTFATSNAYVVGSLEQLIAQVKADPAADWRSAMVKLVIGYAKILLADPLSQEIFRWELTDKNELTDALGAARETLIQSGILLIRDTYPETGEIDLEAISAVLLASATYLVLRSRSHATFIGIDFTQVAGQARIETTIHQLLSAIAP